MDRVPVYILAGGKSSRFGSDKARALLDGKPLILRVMEAVSPYAARVTVVAETAGKYDDLGLTTIADIEPGRGPMGGLRTALLDNRDEDWLLLLSCDLVRIEPVWIESLLAARSSATAAALYADRWQPLVGVYHRSCLAEVEACMARRRRSIREMLDALDATRVAVTNATAEAIQVNTPAELDAVSRRHAQNPSR